jgi:hypothetical protein
MNPDETTTFHYFEEAVYAIISVLTLITVTGGQA